MARLSAETEQIGLDPPASQAYYIPVRNPGPFPHPGTPNRATALAFLGAALSHFAISCKSADKPLRFSEAMATPERRSATYASLAKNPAAASPRGDSLVRVGDFSEGLAAARLGDVYGYIDGSGAVPVTPRFDHAGPFSEGLAPVLLEGRWGYADRTGREAIAPAFDWAGPFSQGRAAVSRDGVHRFIDAAGDSVGPSSFSDARAFSGGYAAVSFGAGDDAAWGFVDTSGRLAIPPHFADVPGGFSEGYAAVTVGGEAGRRMGFIDSSGGFAMDSLFDAAGDFSGGVAPVGRGELEAGRFRGTWHYIGRDGTRAFPGDYAWAGAFHGDRALVRSEGGAFAVIDRAGSVVHRPADSQVSGPRRRGWRVTYELRNAHVSGAPQALRTGSE